MTLNHQISSISKTVRYQLRNLSHIRKFLTLEATEVMVHSLISSRLDFCNAILINLPEFQINRPQRLQNSAARLITCVKRSSHITPTLQALHWLPVRDRIICKVLLMIFHSLDGTSPDYINDLIHVYKPPRQLRSSNNLLLNVPRCLHSWGDRCFSHAGPSLWNSVPLQLRKADTCSKFKTHLKTYLFRQQ
ncbi:uncharacterized protein [Asterias amurensis]|uniref:uncharacterized protein n=1 Tax=Asterias amurensis TaxID=7602 RepID=UPI003AB62D2D